MKQTARKYLQKLALAPLAVMLLSFTLVPFAPLASAAPLTIGGGVDASVSEENKQCVFTDGDGAACPDGENLFQTVTNVLLFIIGAISVIMLIIGGIRYTISGGDSAAVTSAKNTILYAIVGIVVAILAYAVVNFVVGSFTG